MDHTWILPPLSFHLLHLCVELQNQVRSLCWVHPPDGNEHAARSLMVLALKHLCFYKCKLSTCAQSRAVLRICLSPWHCNHWISTFSCSSLSKQNAGSMIILLIIMIIIITALYWSEPQQPLSCCPWALHGCALDGWMGDPGAAWAVSALTGWTSSCCF